MGSWFSNQGLNPHLLHWKLGILTTGLSGKTLHLTFPYLPAHQACVSLHPQLRVLFPVSVQYLLVKWNSSVP